MLRFCCLALLTLAAPLAARDSLGIFGEWGAFRDDAPVRCYALAMPARTSGSNEFDPYAAVSHWPAQRVRGQVHFRTSRKIGDNARITLRVGRETFTLTGSDNNAWAQDTRGDADILAAMRSASTMVLSTRDAGGRLFTNTYDLGDVASAIDAASVGCARS